MSGLTVKRIPAPLLEEGNEFRPPVQAEWLLVEVVEVDGPFVRVTDTDGRVWKFRHDSFVDAIVPA